MGWATKTNCDTPLPTLGNPRSLVPKIERTSAAAELALLSLGNYLASPERHPTPTAASSINRPSPCGGGVGGEGYSPYTEAITLTDADDLADHLPTTTTTDVATTDTTIPADSILSSPRLSPAGTSLSEPDTLVSGGSDADDLADFLPVPITNTPTIPDTTTATPDAQPELPDTDPTPSASSAGFSSTNDLAGISAPIPDTTAPPHLIYRWTSLTISLRTYLITPRLAGEGTGVRAIPPAPSPA